MSSVVSNGSRKHLTSYYESLRSNVMSILGHVKVPSEEMHAGAVAAAGVCSAGAAVSSGPSKDNFDSYLSFSLKLFVFHLVTEGLQNP